MYASLSVFVVVLAIVLAVSVVCHIVVLRRIARLSAAQRDHDPRDVVALRAAIAQMLEQVTELSMAVDHKLGQLPMAARAAQAERTGPPANAAGLYGPDGRQEQRITARPAPAAPRPAAPPASGLEALLEASDRVVDKVELARQAGIGVGEVELWLRRQAQKSTPAAETSARAGA